MIWIKHHIEGTRNLFLWFTGFTWTIVIDWQHIVSRIAETCIVAFWNGVATTAGGIALLWALRKLKKSKLAEWFKNKYKKVFKV